MDYNTENSIGIHIDCLVGVYTVFNDTLDKMDRFIDSVPNSIIIIDETHVYLCDTEERQRFSRLIEDKPNYFIFITRSNLSEFPISMFEYYKLQANIVKGRYINDAVPIYKELERNKTDWNLDVVITEDSKSGYQLFNLMLKDKPIEVLHSSGNLNFNKILNSKELKDIEEKLDKRRLNILLVFDSAAMGAHIGSLLSFINNYSKHNITLLTNESTEHILLMSGVLKNKVNLLELTETYDYANSSVYYSWERYYTKLLEKIISNVLGFSNKTYSKSLLEEPFTSESSLIKIERYLTESPVDRLE